MDKVKASDIAKYFRESVSFNFEREDIISYQQIESLEDDFFTLIDRDAYFALLNDIIGYDNQLKNIFCDLFDAKLGIHCFANKNARMSPRSRISYFLTQSKYQHYQTSITKVYLAFNTWLIFFDAGTIDAEWRDCPFCGSVVRNNVCTNKLCKKTKDDSIKASLELSTLLAEERAGVDTITPSCWYYINENSEFYNEYKAPILTYIKKRKAKEDENKNRILTEATKEINQIKTIFKLEISKTKPDFEMIIKRIENSNIIQIASAYNDRSFIQKLALLKKNVNKEKQKYEDGIENESKSELFNQTVKDFLASYIIIQKKLASKTKDLNSLKEELKKADNSWAMVKANMKLGFKVNQASAIQMINEYETGLQQETIKYIKKEESQKSLETEKRELLKMTTILMNKLNCITVKDNKASTIMDELNRLVETNKAFDKIRFEDPQEYLEIVYPVRKKLAKLIKEENEYKLVNFKEEAIPLLKSIKNANPKDSLSWFFSTKVSELKYNSLYFSINQNIEYNNLISQLSEKLNCLVKEEKIYQDNLEKIVKRKKKNKKIILITSCSLIVILITILLIIIIK